LGDAAAKLAAPLFEELLFGELGFVRGARSRGWDGGRGGGGNIRRGHETLRRGTVARSCRSTA
jgi:hypothetical protein